MEKKIFGGALAVLMLTACSNDELVNVNRDGDEITFSVVTNAGSRASDVYCNNNKPADFEVFASHGGKKYIDGDIIKYQGSEWINTDGTRYWPESGDVTFYAHRNAAKEFTWEDPSTVPTIKDFTVASKVEDQVDLIYSVQKASKPTNTETNPPVMLNFRHALSQIVFQAKNINPNIYVEVSGVSVCKLTGKNTFTYPSQKTDANIVNHDGTTGTITYDGSWGTWATISTPGTVQYDVTFSPVALNGNKNATASSLTNTNETGKEFSKKALLLLPQTTTAWDVTSAGAEGTAANQSGSYFLVKCKIYNVADSAKGFDAASDVCLWPGEGVTDPKDVAIPVAVDWEQGKKYIYTFVFGDGNGGYDPDPDPEDPDPEPVLVPIKFNVTVDDFVPVANEDIEMDEPDNN